MQEAFLPTQKWCLGRIYILATVQTAQYQQMGNVSFPQILIHSLNKHLPANYYEPSTRLRIVNRSDSCHQGANSLVREKRGEKMKYTRKSTYL